jgi:hypothetical protein
METKILIQKLQNRLTEYKSSELYSAIPLKQDINSIQIALSLFEMAMFCNRPIKGDEKYWFKGSYYIAYDISGEWEDISKMYDEMVEIVNKKF